LTRWNFPTKSQTDGRSLIPRRVNQLISIDIIPNLPTTQEGYEHLILFVDNYSFHVSACPLKAKTTIHIHQAVLNFLNNNGIPTTIRIDLDTPLLSAMKSLLKSYPITIISSPANNHASNSYAELSVSFIKQKLQKLMYDTGSPQGKNQWSELLPIAYCFVSHK